MANYNGARRKTTVGNRNAYSQSSQSTAKNKQFSTQNSGGDGWGNVGRRPSRSSDDGWGDDDRRRYSKDDGWGEIDRRPSNYTSDDMWGPLPSQPAVQENAWEKRGSRKNQKSNTNQGKKQVPLVGPQFSWDDEDEYPALESRQQPVENVWIKRKEKLEGRKAMEPTNQTEEELMIQKAIELSKREAKEEEERRRQIEEEYAIQNQILASNPEYFSEFLTPDELAEASKSLEPEATEYNDFPDANKGKESVWDYPEPVESQQSQKQTKKSGRKKKRNKSQSSAHLEDEINTQNALSDNQKFNHNKQNESILPEQIDQDNWSSNQISKSYYNEAEEDESQFVDESSDYIYHSAEVKSTISQEAADESKVHGGSQPKISKVIDMFGGWGSKKTPDSLISSHKEEGFESYNKFSSANSVSNNKEIYQDDSENPKEISDIDENLEFLKSSSKHREVKNFSMNEKSQVSVNEGDSWNTECSSSNIQCNNEMKHSLYSHVESNIAASASSTFCNAATNSSDTGASYLSKKSTPKDDDTINSIVQDYASLAINCTKSSSKEKVPVQRKSKDIFSSVAPLLNEDSNKPDITNLQHSSMSEHQNLSIPVDNHTSEREITYSLSNANSAEFSNKAPNENISESWNDSKFSFPTNPERNEINNSLFSHHINESVPNSHEDIPVDPAIPAPVQRETQFPCQPNPVMPNLLNPSFMMGMNPLMMQQMMMLNNPFFLQQLHQMEMYYRTMSMPFNSPLIPPMAMPSFNPMLSNPMGNFLNDESNSNMIPAPEQSNPPIPPPCQQFEDENLGSISIGSDAPKSSAVPNVEFDNSWLSGLLSEGAAHMDSYIPPPRVPVSHPHENPHRTPNLENKIDMNIAQDTLHSTYGSETIPQNSNCDTKNFKVESSASKHGRTDGAANTRNVNPPKPSVPETVEASGWGDIDDVPKKNSASGWGDLDDVPKKSNASWNDDEDGWADEKVTTSKSMINSSRYASSRQATTRQPIRQPRQPSKWR